MFSNRLPPNLAPNRLARAIERMRAERRPIVDLTQSNPTTAGFAYPADLLAPLASSRALIYEPYPFGSFDARRTNASTTFARSRETLLSKLFTGRACPKATDPAEKTAPSLGAVK